MKLEKKYFILLLFFILGFTNVKAHPFYVSICQIEFNGKTHSLEIALKVFANDLLLGLENEGKRKLYLGEKKENPKTDEYIYDYLKTQLVFAINNKKDNFSFIGKEMENDVLWIYLEIENVNHLNKLEVECKLLTEVIENQSTIVQVDNRGTIKNLLLNKSKTADSLEFEK